MSEADTPEDIEEPEEIEEPDEPTESEEAETEPEPEAETEEEGPGEQIGCEACGTPESEMLVVYDKNLDKPWRGGNPYSRICPSCGARTFSSKSYWKSQAVPYVIPVGEEEPQPLFRCPYDDCDETFLGKQDECPGCGRELIWED